MICEKITKQKCVFRIEPSDTNSKNFCVPLNLIPENPRPKKIVFIYRRGKKTQTWSMTWNKFLSSDAIGNVGLPEKEKMIYRKHSN